ncbi:MAG TPA: S1C family serine protease [Solirubrobacteraceae bacterium]|jgi:serine protease Do
MTVQELESAIAGAAQRLGPAVVGLRRGWGGGCGVVIAPGKVLTNAHNLRDDELAVTFAGGGSEAGRVTGYDPELDLAVIAVDTRDAQPIEPPQADAGGVAVGRAVLALANPGGRGLHVAPGFVTSAQASFRGPGGRRVRDAIEHTAPLPRGSSGGPLVSLDGGLLGINSVRMSPGLVLATALHGKLAERLQALGEGKQPRPLRLGVAVAPPALARRLRSAVGLPERDGILVRAVQDGSPAAQAGLNRGDLLVAAAGQPLDGLDGLHQALDDARSARRLELTVVRGAEELRLTVSFDGV